MASNPARVFETAIARFAGRVTGFTRRCPDGCLMWTGCLSTRGYGKTSFRGRSDYAHRAAFMTAAKQPIPGDLVVRHTCDNKRCVEPSHLILGTPAENNNDIIVRGRANPPRGELACHSKMTNTQVREMRMKHSQGATKASLAREYGLVWDTVDSIIQRKTWIHI